jgi:signal transduction histidine kinase
MITNVQRVFALSDELEIESARDMFQKFGKEGLVDYLNRLDRIFGGSHSLLDSHGIDLVSGRDQSTLLPHNATTPHLSISNHHWLMTYRSNDGNSWLTVEGVTGGSNQLWQYSPYYLLVIFVAGILCWVTATSVVSPLRKIAVSIAQFGEGHLSTRIRTKREDEIGELSRSFDEMADKIQQLLMNERRLLSDISHELRSPLARLTVATNLAQSAPNDKPSLERIQREVDRINSLVADIIEINFLEADPALHKLRRVNLSMIISDVVEACEPEVEFKHCRIEINGNTPRTILGDPEILRRAIENVLRNSIRYSPKDTSIVFDVEDFSDKSIVLRIRDFGPGVPEDMLEQIFDPFFRVEEARNSMGGGSGLGLSIAKRAVHLHQGSIVAENLHPGLCVKITFPRQSA